MQTDTNPRVERALRAIDGLKLGDVRAFARQLAASFPMVAAEIGDALDLADINVIKDAQIRPSCHRDLHAEQTAKPESAS